MQPFNFYQVIYVKDTMKNLNLLIVILSIYSVNIEAQINPTEYLLSNYEIVDTNNCKNQIVNDLATENNIVMYGSVHGSKLGQSTDLWLMKSLSKKGFKTVVLEMSHSYAYFMNKFIRTGNTKYLDYVINNSYFWRTPQDASLELRNKWINFRYFLVEEKLISEYTIIGIEPSDNIDVVQLNDLLPNTVNNNFIDSLRLFTTDIKYRGSSYYFYDTENIDKGKYDYSEYLPEPNVFGYVDRFKDKFMKDSLEVLNHFMDNKDEAAAIFNKVDARYLDRDKLLFEYFKKYCGDLIDRGEKIYISYGYAHVLQEELSGKKYLGKYIKDHYDSTIGITSIVTEFLSSSFLHKREFEEGEQIKLKDVVLNKKIYKGYSTYPSEERGTLQLSGKKFLSKINNVSNIVMYSLNREDSPFREVDLLIAARKKSKKLNWIIKDSSVTTDYFQYLIRINGSAANEPFPKI